MRSSGMPFRMQKIYLVLANRQQKAPVGLAPVWEQLFLSQYGLSITVIRCFTPSRTSGPINYADTSHVTPTVHIINEWSFIYRHKINTFSVYFLESAKWGLVWEFIINLVLPCFLPSSIAQMLTSNLLYMEARKYNVQGVRGVLKSDTFI